MEDHPPAGSVAGDVNSAHEDPVETGSNEAPPAGSCQSAEVHEAEPSGKPSRHWPFVPNMTEVLACHATQDIQIRVALPKKAKIRHMKQALAKCLCSDDILTRGMLTHKVEGVYKALKDDSLIGDLKQVTVACADFTAVQGKDMMVRLTDVDIAESETSPVNATAVRASSSSAGQASTATHLSSSKSSSLPWKETVPSIKPGGKITKRQAINMQRELYEGFKADTFQFKLREIARKPIRLGRETIQRERQELLLSVQKSVLPKYGFEGTLDGVYKMMGAMGPFVEDPEVKELNGDINKLLGIDSPPETWENLSQACKELQVGQKGKEQLKRRPPMPLMQMVPAGGLEKARPPSAVPSSLTFDRWPSGKPRPYKLFIAGTWNEFCPAEMTWQNGLFLNPVTVGPNGWESFQILKNGNWNATIYPSIPDAGPFDQHSVCGPDNKGHGKNWQIGRYAEDEAPPGSQFAIVATVDKEGAIRLVHWQPLA